MSEGSQSIVAAEADELWTTAERLRVVRRAHERFLALWAVDRLFDDPAAAARFGADAARFEADPDRTPDNLAGPGAVKPAWFHAPRLVD